MSTNTKKTAQEKLAAAELKMKNAIAAFEKLNNKAADLTKESAGMQQLLVAVQTVADLNKVSVADAIKAVSKFKRTGLKIANPVRTTKAKALAKANVDA